MIFCHGRLFCTAWILVSHVNVTATKLVPDEGPQKRMYTVEYVKVIKIPPGLSSLSEEIFTPKHSATCGLQLDVGKEYLLAGKSNDGVLRVISCGQIISDDPEDQSFGIVMEWKNVSEKLL
ncbi:hypothetical protein OESDEN_13878, partial [Oesophagostomum dentatum]